MKFGTQIALAMAMGLAHSIPMAQDSVPATPGTGAPPSNEGGSSSPFVVARQDQGSVPATPGSGAPPSNEGGSSSPFVVARQPQDQGVDPSSPPGAGSPNESGDPVPRMAVRELQDKPNPGNSKEPPHHKLAIRNAQGASMNPFPSDGGAGDPTGNAKRQDTPPATDPSSSSPTSPPGSAPSSPSDSSPTPAEKRQAGVPPTTSDGTSPPATVPATSSPASPPETAPATSGGNGKRSDTPPTPVPSDPSTTTSTSSPGDQPTAPTGSAKREAQNDKAPPPNTTNNASAPHNTKRQGGSGITTAPIGATSPPPAVRRDALEPTTLRTVKA